MMLPCRTPAHLRSRETAVARWYRAVMARAPLPITMRDAESLFSAAGIKFAPERRFLSRQPRLRGKVPSGQVEIKLLGNRDQPPHLVRAAMTIGTGVVPAELASALGPWYQLADAVRRAPRSRASGRAGSGGRGTLRIR